MNVRRLRANEAKLFKALRLRALADAPAAFAEPHDEISGQPDSYWGEMTRSVTEPGRHAMFVAEDDGTPVGIAFGMLPRDVPDVPHVGGMWVDPGARTRGIGRALAEAVFDWARQRGYGRIGLWVTEGNLAAATLYARLGFTPTGRRDRLPVDPTLSIVEMERAL